MIIFSPKKFDRDELLPFFNELDASVTIDNVIIDFSKLYFSLPTAVLIVGSKIRKWVSLRKNIGLKSSVRGLDNNKSAHSYLMHLGFFDYINVGIGNKMGFSSDSNNYLPITKIVISPFDPVEESLQDWHGNIMSTSRRLSAVLAGSNIDSQELRTYAYSIREIIRNVFEHSQAVECFVCGQRFSNGQAEIAIVDEGCGVFSTISQAFDVEDDADAIGKALMPGVSRTSLMDESENVYGNSGFGLYVLSELAASFGWFAFGSGAARVIGHSNTVREMQPFSFDGTFFGMRLKCSPKNFSSLLEDIIHSGESEADVHGVKTKASGISRLAE